MVGQVDTPQNGETNDVITTTRYDDATGLPVAVTGPYTTGTPAAQQAVTRTVYNDLGLPAAVSDALGNTTYQGYDADGNLTSTTSAEGVTSSFTYDAHGNLKSATSGGVTTSTTYTAQGQVESTTDAAGNTTTYQYDANGNH